MRVLLRDQTTGLYATSAGSWTPSIKEAFGFPNGARAIRFATGKNLQNAEILFSFGDDPTWDIHIPITPSAHQTLKPDKG